MKKPNILIKKKLLFVLAFFEIVLIILAVRVFYIQFVNGANLQSKAFEQQTRDRLITPNRGTIYDRNMVGIAKTETVASVSVIHNQVKNVEEVSRLLSEKLLLDYDLVFKKVSKKVALERIKTKVPKAMADEIRALKLTGVVVDEDVKRVYPFSNFASQVIGFVGKDNQGIVGLEAKYDKYLKGESGKILTETDVRGKEIKGSHEVRVKPIEGNHLITSLDTVLQQYAEQTLQKIVEAKDAKRGTIILMDPKNGEIFAMANKPDFDLNEPFEINSEELKAVWEHLTEKEKNDALNQMWRNFSINDTYEPGSTFKVVTAAAGLEEGVITKESTFTCNGYLTVGGRNIKCWRFPRNHAHETFVEGVYNSCNPVFMETAARVGPENFYKYLKTFGLMGKTGIDVPGEAAGIMHKLENVGSVELATMSFGQSFQITPLQLLRAGSACINGGYLVTPHFGLKTIDENGNVTNDFSYPKGTQAISKETSDVLREILEGVVYAGTGNKTYIPGYKVGGKTATSEKLPRRSGKYIASFMAFAPADDPKVIALVLIDEPKGAYYGGQVAGPVMKELFENTLPYLHIEPVFTEEEAKLPNVSRVKVPDVRGLALKEAKKILDSESVKYELSGEGDLVDSQFPLPSEEINKDTKIIIYLK